MKGVTELQWALVVLLPTFVLLAFVVSPLEAMIDARVENNARFIALDIAGSINLLQASVDGTTHEISLPNTQCEIEVHKNFVRVRTTGSVETKSDANILESGLSVQESDHSCAERTLTAIRNSNTIRTTP